MRFAGFERDNLLSNPRQQAHALVFVELSHSDRSLTSDMTGHIGKARREKMGAIGATYLECDSFLYRPGIVGDEQHPAAAYRATDQSGPRWCGAHSTHIWSGYPGQRPTRPAILARLELAPD